MLSIYIKFEFERNETKSLSSTTKRTSNLYIISKQMLLFFVLHVCLFIEKEIIRSVRIKKKEKRRNSTKIAK